MKKKRLWNSLVAAALIISLIIWGIPAQAAENTPQTFTGNLALGKTASVSGVEPGMAHLTGDLAIDGDLNTRWSSGLMKSGKDPNQTQTPQWITIDLVTASSEITSINIHYFKLVWGQKYQIQTSAANDSDAVWETLSSKEVEPDAARQNPTDTFTYGDGITVKRYLRIYFEKVNTQAGGDAISITDMEINGTQEISGDTEPSTANQALSRISNMTLDLDDTVLPLPAYENYTVSIKGSEVKNVLALDGSVTTHNIGDRSFQVILKAENKQDSSDQAEKSITVTVPDKSSLSPERFPDVSSPNPEPPVIPNLQEWYGYEGQFHLTSESRILICDRQNVDLQKAAENMQSDLKEFTGISPEIISVSDDSQVTGSDIYLESMEEDVYQTGDEGYYLITDETGIRIYSTTYTGCLYGTITIEQILWQNPKDLLVPCGVIRDYPNYEIRGVMLDIARTPYRLQLLKDYAKILSWYKLNEYQLHINDNVHFNTHYPTYESIAPGTAMHRIESDIFPSLKSLSKGTTDAAKYFENIYGDPLYTKDEWRDLQSESLDFGVKVLTEIDSPSHAVVYSKYAQDNPDNISWLGPIHSSRNYEQIDLTGENSERALKFMTTLWDEYTNPENPTFTNDVVNIGMDEYWNITAAEKPAMANYIITLHDLMKKNGKTCRMWGQIGLYLDNVVSDEVIEGLNDMQLDVWYTSYENVSKRISQGFKIINMDEGWLYGNPLRDRRDVVNVEYLYENWTPEIFNGITLKKGEPALLGAKTALWGDVNRKGVIERDLNARILPAAAVLSEKTWGGVREIDTYEAYEFKYNRLKEGPGTEIAMNIPSASALVADYDFTNLKGNTLYDASGNSYDAKVTGGTVVTEDGTAFLKFDGTTKVETPLKTLSYPYTVSFDLKVSGGDANDKEASLFSGYDGRLQAAGENGSLSLNRSFFQQSFDYTVPLDQKVQVTVVGTYQTTKLYINGKLHKVLCRTNQDEFDLTDLASSFVFPLEVIGDGFQGYMGNIRFYNRAFSPELISGQADEAYVNVAQNAAAAGNSQRKGQGSFDNADKKIRVAWKAVDGDGRDLSGAYSGMASEKDSYWKGGGHADDSLTVDLGEPRDVEKIVIQWEGNGYAQSFKIQASDDGVNWQDIKTVQGNSSDLSTLNFPAVHSQYFRMLGVTMNGSNSYAIREFEIYEKTEKEDLQKALELAKSIAGSRNLDFDAITDSSRDFWDSYVLASSLSQNPLARQSEIDQAADSLKEQTAIIDQTWTASFQGGSQAAGTAPQTLSAKSGDLITLPANTFVKPNAVFKGWTYGGKIFQPGDSFRMPGEHVVFTALWKDTATPDTEPETNTDSEPNTEKPVPPVIPAPGKVMKLKSVKQTTKSIKLSWEKAENATGYIIEQYQSKGKKWDRVKTTTSTSFTVKKLKAASVYKYRVRGCRNTGAKILEGTNSSTLTTATAPKKPKLSWTKLNSNKIRLTWKKGTKADAYEIYVKYGKRKYGKLTTKPVKKLSFTKGKLKKGRTYSFKVRGYKKAGNMKSYSAYSNIKTVTLR